MRLHLDCSMGAAGDMLMAALYELLPDKNVFCERMEALGLPGVTLSFEKVTKCGVAGTHANVTVGGESEISHDISHKHHKNTKKHNHAEKTHNHGPHRSYNEICELICELELPDNIIDEALEVYRLIGEAEAAAHGTPVEDVHLHEVGALDAVADVVGCCLLMNMLGITDVTATPVHVGSGSVKCAHGIMPVPAPAAAELLKGIPIYGGAIEGELCTPTGAALLRHFVRCFGDMPVMTISKIGYGMGSKDFPHAANCLRVFLSDAGEQDTGRDVICEISCNLDDMSPEAVGAVFDVLFDNGALDVFAAPVQMKKNRPAVMLTCLCPEEERSKFVRLILEHTSTLGVRIKTCRRELLKRSVDTVMSEYGEIRIKRAEGLGIVRRKPEYEDVLAASRRCGVPFLTVYTSLLSNQSD